MKLSELDKRIINALVDDGRLSYRQIAKAVRSSPSTIMHHIQEMQKAGIIRGYTVSLDYEKLKYDVHIIVEMKIAKGKFEEVAKRVVHHPNVLTVYDHIGAFDATVVARFRNKQAMNIFLKTIQCYDFVERTETKLVLSTLKRENIKVS